MPIHKLAEGPITITVLATEVTQGNYGAQVKFTGDNDTLVFVSEMTAQKQLARLGLTVESCIGQALKFEQIKKNGTTYTNVYRAAAGEAGAAAPAASAPAAPAYTPAPKLSMPELIALYSECVSGAMITLGAKCEEAGVPIDASAIQAAAATLFIKATR